MNKLTPQNEQQEHMVQILLAKMQGFDVELLITDGIWRPSITYSMCLDMEYRIKSYELPITRQMWAMIDKKWKWAAMDEGGCIWFYENQPFPNSSAPLWSFRAGRGIKSDVLNINTDGIKWRQSLTERPRGGVK